MGLATASSAMKAMIWSLPARGRGRCESRCSPSAWTRAGKRQTAGSRLRRALKQVVLWCRANRHEPVIEQQRSLNLKLRGHYGYYGITGNFRALQGFWDEVRRTWRRWLDRRSQRARMNWTRFQALLQRYPLSPPRVVQSVYAQRSR